MAGAGFKIWTTGDLVNASEFNTYVQEQVVMVFADSTARDSAVTSPSEGMFAYLQDTNDLTFYNGSAWANFIGEGDITAVNTSATSGLNGGGTSGAIDLTVDVSQLTDGTSISVDTSNDLLILEDVSDGTVKKVNPNQIASGGGSSIGIILALG